MSETDPVARAEELRTLLEEANHRYHVLDAPTMSDREYDLRFRELVADIYLLIAENAFTLSARP